MEPPRQATPELTSEALLTRLSRYLDHLADEVQKVEQTIAAPPEDGDALPGSAIVQLQSLDRLRQSLEDLALLTLCLGRTDAMGRPALECPGQIRNNLRLEATRALFDQPCGATRPVRREASGEVDLF